MHYDLKECPVCKGNGRMVVNIRSYATGGIVAFVRCEKCGLQTRSHPQNTKTRDTAFIERAAASWNKRGGFDDPA